MPGGIGFEIRDATPDDAAALAGLHAQAATVGYAHIFPTDSPAPTSTELTPGWSELLSRSDALTLVATVDDGGVAGSVCLAQDTDVPAGLLIKRLHVRPDLWANGLGATLHDCALDRARQWGATELNLWVLEQNSRARAMYERRGWVLCEPRRTFANEPPTIVDVLYELKLANS